MGRNRSRGLVAKGNKGNSGDENVLDQDCDGSNYRTLYIWQNSLNYTLKLANFIIYKIIPWSLKKKHGNTSKYNSG